MALLIGLLAGLIVNILAGLLPLVGSEREDDSIPGAGHRRLMFEIGRRRLRWALVPLVTAGLSWLVLGRAALPSSGESGLPPALVLVYLCILLCILVVDLEHRRVLNVVTLPTTVLGLLAAATVVQQPLGSALIGGVVGLVVFLLPAVVRPGAMGMGDVKLAGMIGVLVGFPAVVSALLLGIAAGGAGALVLLLLRRTEWKGTMAYAPYLAAGAALVLLAQGQIIGRADSWFLPFQ